MPGKRAWRSSEDPASVSRARMFVAPASCRRFCAAPARKEFASRMLALRDTAVRMRGGWTAECQASAPGAACCASTKKNRAACAAKTLFSDDAVGPLDEADEDRGIAELETPLSDVGFRNATAAAASATCEDRNLAGDELIECFLERGPADRNDRIHDRLARQDRGFAEEENLYFVTGVGKRQGVIEYE